MSLAVEEAETEHVGESGSSGFPGKSLQSGIRHAETRPAHFFLVNDVRGARIAVAGLPTEPGLIMYMVSGSSSMTSVRVRLRASARSGPAAAPFEEAPPCRCEWPKKAIMRCSAAKLLGGNLGRHHVLILVEWGSMENLEAFKRKRPFVRVFQIRQVLGSQAASASSVRRPAPPD